MRVVELIRELERIDDEIQVNILVDGLLYAVEGVVNDADVVFIKAEED
jgi:hypothetical protein